MENESRVALVERICQQFFENGSEEKAVIDLLANLRHFCYGRNLPFNKLLNIAAMHFHEGCAEEQRQLHGGSRG